MNFDFSGIYSSHDSGHPELVQAKSYWSCSGSRPSRRQLPRRTICSQQAHGGAAAHERRPSCSREVMLHLLPVPSRGVSVPYSFDMTVYDDALSRTRKIVPTLCSRSFLPPPRTSSKQYLWKSLHVSCKSKDLRGWPGAVRALKLRPVMPHPLQMGMGGALGVPASYTPVK